MTDKFSYALMVRMDSNATRKVDSTNSCKLTHGK